ncbi:glutamate-5-semialdehyde dehydrogenase [Alicyclobacillus macrosporangiidus]|uniref:glutamate-5-semialdehyde dehydrogenase n=1 Tax=Alicyclobacillus macrosporangiidus TaxID=392015 RepID=UPI0026F28CCD|nr:glutamate-5-semialdehyde dehydrogenase [Alicyclobacillus macrosporangiidus]
MALSAEQVEAILNQARAAKAASRALAVLGSDRRNEALRAIMDALWADREAILAANAEDVASARSAGEAASRVDRLILNERRMEQMMESLRQVMELSDPVGTVDAAWTRPNGLRIERVRVPFGVIAIIYESRPNVTVDAAALALKTGNAVVLRGGKEALRSNAALVTAMRAGLARAGLPEEAVQLVTCTDRDSVDVVIRAKGLVDLAIPRGGAGLIARVVERALVPVIETGVGNCHVYVDRAADLGMAEAIVVNAKVQRPSVCNAAETLLVHQAVAEAFLPRVARALAERGVEIRACPRTLAVLGAGGGGIERIVPAAEADWDTEYLDLILAVRVVDSLDDAIAHIERHGTRHSEAIVTEDQAAAEAFLAQVDAAAVYHNASTRFTDGFEFGFGAEMGISTQKLHARGPMGLPELTTYKYVVRGTGQVRA